MDELLASIAAKRERLDKLRPFSPEALARLEHYYDVELTYTSNAIEGNTLSPVETTLVIEKGITISGKPLKDHLEALDHYDAIRYVRERARQTTPLAESDFAIYTGWLCNVLVRRLRAAMPTFPVTCARKPGDMRFHLQRKSLRSWAIFSIGSGLRPTRLRQRSWRISDWLTSILLTTATGARHGSS